MIELTETTTTAQDVTYTTPAPDTSNIVGTVSNGVATFTYGGSSLALPVDALPTLVALVATVGAGIQPVTQAPVETAPEPEPMPEPAPEPDPAP